MTSDRRLIDCKGIMREWNVSRKIAERWMRDVPRVPNTGRRWLVRRRDIERINGEAEAA